MKKIWTLGVLLLIFSLGLQSQDKEKPKQRGIIKIFANYHTTFGKDDNVMEIKRAYLGYKAKLSKYYSAKIILDVEAEGRYIAYLKNASLKYKKNKWTVHAGMIATKQFKVQEKFWAYRYIQKSFQDQYKYNSSADLGLSVQYAVLKNLSIDFIIQNGGGYKDIKPTGNFRKGIGARAKLSLFDLYFYYDINTKQHINKQSLASMLGVNITPAIRFAAEYNVQWNHKFKKDHHLYGYSLYTTYKFNSKWEIFARYDNLASNTLSGDKRPWNISNKEKLAISGIQYHPVKGVKISANFRRNFAKQSTSQNINSLFLNLEYKW